MSFILSKTESFSTDTASLTYASSALYTLSTLANAPVGTFITFTYAANTNTRTQTTVAPTQTAADMNVNGIRLFTRSYNAASTAAQPTAVAIQIGKGLKGVTQNLYKSTGKTTSGSMDMTPVNTLATKVGIDIKEYNESTGILIIDAGFNQSTAITSAALVFSDLGYQTDGYITINASKSPALTGVPLLQPRIAVMREEYASGTAGQTTSTSYTAKRLNVLEDYSGIVQNSSSFTGPGGTNTQFTLAPGRYTIDAGASLGQPSSSNTIRNTKIKLRNVTDGVNVVIGATTSQIGIGGVDNPQPGWSGLTGTFSISTAKTFEIQAAVTSVASGGTVAANFGDSEVYTIVKLQRIGD